MTTTPLSPRPGEPTDPDLRDRYRTDASREREERRAEAARQAATVPPSRTPVGPIRVIALLVTVALVLLAGFSLAGPMLKQSETVERPLVATSALSFAGGTGQVRVRAAEPGEQPRAVVTSTWGLRKPTTSITSSGGTTRLTSRCPGPDLGTVCRVDWLVVVPPTTEIDLHHGVGEVSIEDITGDLDLEVGVADVSISGAEGERVRVDIGVGALDYEAVEAPRLVEARVGVGDARIRVPEEQTYRVDIPQGMADTTNRVGNDPSSSRRITVEVGVGAVRVDPS